jgi:hypothetical protein
MIKSQINNLILGPSFGHNLCFKYANGSCEPILDILVSRTFHWYKELFNLMHFDPLQLLSENSRVYRESNSQSGSSFGSVGVHSLTRSYTLESMKRDSQASFLARTFASPCLGREPKVRAVTIGDRNSVDRWWLKFSWPIHFFFVGFFSCYIVTRFWIGGDQNSIDLSNLLFFFN